MKRNHYDFATFSALASFCQESEATLWCHHDTAWLSWWCLRISGWSPQVIDATALYLPSCLEGWHLHGWETSTGEIFDQTEEKKPRDLLQHWNPEFLFQMTQQFQLLSLVIADDAALASIKEQNIFHCSYHKPWAMSIWLNFFEGELWQSQGFWSFRILPE